ncbi:MAG: hypothetical protein CR975_03095 [Gammaproteobacteria bacterium]|nr:MAG: hypothetical protein CR975_03095 [Gammaproteobacteria bacterium]
MSNSINSLLIAYSPVDNVIVPGELIECILPYAIPLPFSHPHRAVVGSLIYKKAKVPIVNLLNLQEQTYQVPLPKNSLGRYRLVMLSSIVEQSFCDHYAIIAYRPPMRLKVTTDNITAINSMPTPYSYNRVRLDLTTGKQQAYIPKLDVIEKELFVTPNNAS